MKLKPILLCLLSGLLLAAPWMYLPLGFTVFLGFIPLLYVEHKTANFSKGYSTNFFMYAFIAMLVWNVGAAWWLAYYKAVQALMVMLTNTFLMAFIWWLFHITKKKWGAPLGYLSLAIYWLGFEFFHFHWPLQYPWLTLGHAFGTQTYFIQFYQFTGVLGGSLVILMVNLTLYRILKNPVSIPFVKGLKIFGLFICIELLCAFGWIMVEFPTKKIPGYRVTIVQPNINPKDKFDSLNHTKNQVHLLKITKSLTTVKKDTTGLRSRWGRKNAIVVFPETSIPGAGHIINGEPQPNTYYFELIEELKDKGFNDILFGQILKDTANQTNYNTAFFITDSMATQYYHKSKLVPGAEYVPFEWLFPFVQPMSDELDGTDGGYSIQEERTVFTTSDGYKIGTIICYESVFGEFVSQLSTNGAEALFIQTNDGWWGNTPGYRMNLAIAQIRAVENQRYIIRASNNGPSVIINDLGKIIDELPFGESASLSSEFYYRAQVTFYARFGDYIGRAAFWLSILFILLTIIKPYIPQLRNYASGETLPPG